MSTSRESLRPFDEGEQTAYWEHLFSPDSELNETEKEIGWLAEESISSAHRMSNVSDIDWEYVEKFASPNLKHQIAKRKRNCKSNWNKSRHSAMIRDGKSKLLCRYREIIRMGISQGYRRPGFDSILTRAADKDRAREHVKDIKQKHAPGEKVYAAWFDQCGKSSWYLGTVRGFKVINTGAYGECRTYDIIFDDGDESNNLADHFVMSCEDYEAESNFNSKAKEGGRGPIGVNNHMGKGDKYAETRGWYTTIYTGEQTFSSLTEAMRAYDKEVARKKGAAVIADELNYPDEWILSSPDSSADPSVYLSGSAPDVRHGAVRPTVL